MDAEFWQQRWQNNQIGFHQSDINKLLRKHWPALTRTLGSDGEVFVPLCGKSRDMLWLGGAMDEADAPRHKVIGVELSEQAIQAFFTDELGANAPSPQPRPGGTVYSHGAFELWAGDLFAFPADRLARTRLAYDRASLIALPPEMRVRYARTMNELLPPAARTLLLTITYDPSEMDGPPFPVPDEEVFDLYGAAREVTLVEKRDGLAGAKNLQDRGLTALTTSVFIIGPKTAVDRAAS